MPAMASDGYSVTLGGVDLNHHPWAFRQALSVYDRLNGVPDAVVDVLSLHFGGVPGHDERLGKARVSTPCLLRLSSQ